MGNDSGNLRYAELLNLRRLPARLNAEEAAAILGFKSHDIPLLIRAGLLKPLASGPRNSVKFVPTETQRLLFKVLKKLADLRLCPIRGRAQNSKSLPVDGGLTDSDRNPTDNHQRQQ